MICFSRSGDQMRNIKIRMIDLGLGTLVISRFDVMSYIVSRVEHQRNCLLGNEIEDKLRASFDGI